MIKIIMINMINIGDPADPNDPVSGRQSTASSHIHLFTFRNTLEAHLHVIHSKLQFNCCSQI